MLEPSTRSESTHPLGVVVSDLVELAEISLDLSSPSSTSRGGDGKGGGGVGKSAMEKSENLLGEFEKLNPKFEALLRIQLEHHLSAQQQPIPGMVVSESSGGGSSLSAVASSPTAGTVAKNRVGRVRRAASDFRHRKRISHVENLEFAERELVLTEAWLTEGSFRPGSKRRRDLFFKGVPVLLRGKVWSDSVENNLRICPDLFSVLILRVEEKKREMRINSSLDDVRRLPSVESAIMLDVPRTFPSLEFFHSGELKCEERLISLLEAYNVFRPSIGYSQGMSFVAAILLLFMDDNLAFRVFANLLERTCLSTFFLMKMPDVKIYLRLHDTLLDSEVPEVAHHFQSLGVNADLYMVNWLMSMYSRVLPLQMVCRVWDIFILDGDVSIFRIALGLLRHISKTLLRCDFDECLHLLAHFPPYENVDEVVASIRSVTLSLKKVKQTYVQCEADLIREHRGRIIKTAASDTARPSS